VELSLRSSPFVLRAEVPEPARPLAAAAVANLDPRTPLTSAQREWVEFTLASLSLRERVGQMINVWVLGDYTNTRDSSFAKVLRWIKQDYIGGVTRVADVLERAGARAALGRSSITGTIPVSLPGFFTRGDGIRRDVVSDRT